MIHQKSNRFYLTAITFLCLLLPGIGNAIKAEATVETRNLSQGQIVGNYTAQAQENQSEEEKIRALLDLQIKALNEENVEVYMSTISKTSPQYSLTVDLLNYLFKEYDVKYELNGLEFVSVSAAEAKVKVTQTTTKIQGPEFKDNKAVIIHILRKDNGEWKFYLTEMDSIDYFN
ncbi:MAG: hypothetical protein KME19_19340 [Microcoleus vaginatus WJT46-NPBG5]|jgi:hypothetical protein|nr:hypothetical protein [Microcoleus vaginatus WJT46-NPBG5]